MHRNYIAASIDDPIRRAPTRVPLPLRRHEADGVGFDVAPRERGGRSGG